MATLVSSLKGFQLFEPLGKTSASYHDVSIAKVVRGHRLVRKPLEDRKACAQFHFFRHTVSIRSIANPKRTLMAGLMVRTVLARSTEVE